MRALICSVGVALLLTASPGWANHGSTSEYALQFEPYAFHLNVRGAEYCNAMSDQDYELTPFIDTTADTFPQVTLLDFVDIMTAVPFGKIFLSMHGNTDGFSVEAFAGTGAQDACVRRFLEYLAMGYTQWTPSTPSGTIYVASSAGGWGISITPAKVADLFQARKTTVYNAACYGHAYAAIAWPNNADGDILGYNIEPTTAWSDANTFWNRQNGEAGKAMRTVTASKSGLTTLQLLGNGDTVLSPVVTSFSPAPNTILNGTVQGSVTFDCDMNANIGANWVIEGLPVLGGGDCIVNNAEWDPWDPKRVTFEIEPIKMGQCIVAVNSRATCADGPYSLDGNTDPYGTDGFGPNRDSYKVALQSNVTDPNWAFGCAGAWAFEEADGTHILWVTDPEIGSQTFEAYGGPSRQERLATIPAAGDPDRPHVYEVIIPKGYETFEIIEIDNDPETQNGSTRPFKLSVPPVNLAELRQLNQAAAAWDIPKSTPDDPVDPHTIPGVGLCDYVFYSSADSLLEETQLLRDWLTQHGFTWQTVLDSPDPNRAKAIFQSAVENAASQGWPRVPQPVIVGGFSLTDPAKNVVGTFVESDSTGECYWGNCVLEGRMFDFDDDNLTDVMGTRLVGYRRVDIQNQVQSIVEYLNGQNVSSGMALIMDGDLTFTCEPTVEPRATLAEVATLFQYHLIPTMALHDSELPPGNPDCGDWAGRLQAGSAIVNLGITEMVGTGTTTSWRISPAFIFQLLYSPTFNMGYLTRRQRIAAEFPGCGLGFIGQGSSLAEMFLTADPDQGTTAVAWLSNTRGAYETRHLMLTERYFQKRFSGNSRTAHQAYFEAIRELGEEEPSMRKYLLGTVAYGWPVYLRGMGTLAVEDMPPAVTLANLNAAPNPFNPQTTLRYTLPGVSYVSLAIYNIQGQQVGSLISRRLQAAGTYTTDWDGRNENGQRVASGVYLATLQAGDRTVSTKLILAK